MSHGQPPHIQHIVPCACGSHDAYWHGPEDGARVYCCDVCAMTIERIADQVAREILADPDFRAEMQQLTAQRVARLRRRRTYRRRK